MAGVQPLGGSRPDPEVPLLLDISGPDVRERVSGSGKSRIVSGIEGKVADQFRSHRTPEDFFLSLENNIFD